MIAAIGNDFPVFEDRFLDGISRQAARRRKAIRHRAGTLDVTTTTAPETLVMRFIASAPRPIVIVELGERNRLSLYVRSAWSRKRGAVLVALENVRVVDNPVRIVATFEWTLNAAWNLDPAEGPDEALTKEVIRRWEQLVVRAVQ
jgi:hypothetical protein